MNKGKVVRLAGFVGALGLSTVLVTTAIQGTGAYFSDSHVGNITGNSGHLNITADPTDLTLDFKDVMPGIANNQEASFTYSTDATGLVDLWMTFDTNSASFQEFTGAKYSTNAPDGGLGQYAYFAVKDTQGTSGFASGNLAFPYTGTTPENQTWDHASCAVNENGVGGSSVYVTDDGANNNKVPWCGIPGQILLRSGMNGDATGTVDVTFGLNGFKNDKTSDQSQSVVNLPFTLVATQHGQRP